MAIQGDPEDQKACVKVEGTVIQQLDEARNSLNGFKILPSRQLGKTGLMLMMMENAERPSPGTPACEDFARIAAELKKIEKERADERAKQPEPVDPDLVRQEYGGVDTHG